MEEPRYFTPEHEQSLIRAAQAGDKDARDELLMGSLPFVRKALRRRYPTVDDQDFEDLVQESVPALLGCIERYDHDHPARARLYVFARSHIHKAVCDYFRHSSVLSYREVLPELAAADDPEASLAELQRASMTRATLATLSPRDRDVLCSRLAFDRAVPRRELAERYACQPHIIEYAERRAVDRFLAAFPGDPAQ